MVRPASSVWRHFVKKRDDDKIISICRYCSKKYYSHNATKMTKHLEKCEKCPLDIIPSPSTRKKHPAGVNRHQTGYNLCTICPREDSAVSDSQLVVATMKSMQSNFAFSNESPSSSNYIPKRTKRDNQMVVSTFRNAMTSSEAEKLSAAFAKAVYASNCSLFLSDNLYWKKCFHHLRPAFNIPSYRDLTNHLLDKEYINARQSNLDKISKAEFLTIITDGWNNINSEGIISFIIATPSLIFYKSVETSDEKYTGHYISEEIDIVMNEMGENKGIALVTDNSSNMNVACRILQMKYPDLYTVGCSAHGLNLLLADIAEIETFRYLISKSKEVIKYFKSTHDLLSIFIEKQMQKNGNVTSLLKLPSEIEWSDMFIMFKSLIDGKESLQEIVSYENIDQEIRQIVSDNNIFWASIESIVNVLKPICCGISVLKSGSAVLSDVPHVFYNIKNSLGSLKSTPLQTDEEERFISALEEREKMCCKPMHLAAYALDPRYQENDLTSEEYRIVVDFITNFLTSVPVEDIIADFAQFQSREGIYSNDAIWNSAKYISPLIWWKGLLSHQSLSHVAIQLFSIPPSTATCERINSVFSNIHATLGNQLSNDRISKLFAVKSNLVLEKKLNCDDNEKKLNWDDDNEKKLNWDDDNEKKLNWDDDNEKKLNCDDNNEKNISVYLDSD